MSDTRGWHARLRPEYRWPYPALEADVWYAVEDEQSSLSPRGWLWLAAEPYRVEVFAEHLTPLRISTSLNTPASEDNPDAQPEVRAARVRESAVDLFPSVPAGVWLQASDVAFLFAGSGVDADGRRRVHRLSDRHFEFRSDVRSGV